MSNAHPAFEFLRSTPIASLGLTVQEYRHRVTGASHLHLACDSDENVFMVAFRTVPMDSTGVAHILEHTALCGSERFPVRDPFFMMLRRSLNTFMNAFTSSDWTAYPFASQNRRDFDNLLQVYLDAAFFPKLEALDFAQEGHRLEFTEPENPDTPLVYKGVVYNEMKGAMSATTSLLWHRLCHHLFPTSTYHYNSGGEPADIPKLSWQQLRDFHARHYHPSNAMFATFGNISAAEHQAEFESRVLHRFQRSDAHIAVAPEQRLSQPLRVNEPYPVADADEDNQTHVIVSWLLGESASLQDALQTQLLVNLLIDNSASPLMAVLETTDLGSSPSPLCGLEDSQKELVFVVGLQGCADDSAEAVEQLILDSLHKIEQQGFSTEAIDSVLHQIEFHRREIGGDSYPYGLQLLLQAMASLTHRGDPVALLDIDQALIDLREASRDPAFATGLLRRLLLDNPHRVTLSLQPDTDYSRRQQAEERARLDSIQQHLDEAGKQALIDQTLALQKRQAQQDDPDILPRITLADVPPQIHSLPEQQHTLGQVPLSRFAVAANGLCFVQALISLPANLNSDELTLLPLYAALLTELGVGNDDYLSLQQRQSLICGGFSASPVLRNRPDSFEHLHGYLLLSAKALQRNHAAMLQLMQDTLQRVRFDEHGRIAELLTQMRHEQEHGITGNGHGLAMLAASAAVNPHARLLHHLDGLESLPRLKALDKQLKQPEALTTLSRQLTALHQRILAGGWRFLVVGDGESLDSYSQSLSRVFGTALPADQQPVLSLPALPTIASTVWTTRSDVNFCASAYPTVTANHADAPALSVLAAVMRNGFLHRAIREQGGAYGGGASHDSANGSFRFFSYRDPRLADTYRDFEAAIDWAAHTAHSPRSVEEAILGVISSLDRPASPAGEAKQQFHQSLFGRDPAFRQRFREGVLATTAADLQRLTGQYLFGKTARLALITAAERAGELPDTAAQVTAL